ncbi:MAG TPA: L-threonylcarbamoyladenylate synthase [Aquihabitans sp.]|nr:L-threonylcarbamoyladenylate synthase [Aquihabitans sp.]
MAERPDQAVLALPPPGDADGLAGVVARVAGVLAAGGTVVLPTDTVYGVAASATVPGATSQLFELKGRADAQPFAVLVADVEQATQLAVAGIVARRWMAERWPGPLTLVLPRRPEARGLALGGDGATIGVRCPDHALVRAVAAAVGPLATTSANRHGEPTPTTALAAASSLTATVGLVVDGGPSSSVASTVVDATGDRWSVLRAGAIAPADLGLDDSSG